jgi:small subunit ribosomal protein S17
MTDTQESKSESGSELKKKESGKIEKTADKKVKKSQATKTQIKTDAKAADQISEEKAEPVIKKKRKTAKEIDKTQAKRLVKPKTSKPKKTRKVVRAVKPEIKARDIGVEVEAPTEGCKDSFCPFHGTLSVRGQILNGIVVTSKMDKTAIVQREVKRFIAKYERFEKRTYSYAVHNPPCLNVKRGDMVKIMECRPLSKSKSFVVIEKL